MGRVIAFPRRQAAEVTPTDAAREHRRRAADLRALAAQHVHAISALEIRAERLERTAAIALRESYTPPPRTFADPLAAACRLTSDPFETVRRLEDLPEWLFEFPPPDEENSPCPPPRATEETGSPTTTEGDPREPA